MAQKEDIRKDCRSRGIKVVVGIVLFWVGAIGAIWLVGASANGGLASNWLWLLAVPFGGLLFFGPRLAMRQL